MIDAVDDLDDQPPHDRHRPPRNRQPTRLVPAPTPALVGNGGHVFAILGGDPSPFRDPPVEAPSPAPQTSGHSGSTGHGPRLPQERVVLDALDVSDDEWFPHNKRPAHLVPAPAPLPIGNGGHIFAIPGRQPAPSRNEPADAPTTPHGALSSSANLKRLRFRNSQGTCKKSIHCPDDIDTGDGSGWYYVIVGRIVGIFNTW